MLKLSKENLSNKKLVKPEKLTKKESGLDEKCGVIDFKVLSTFMPYLISYPKNATESCIVIPVIVFHI